MSRSLTEEELPKDFTLKSIGRETEMILLEPNDRKKTSVEIALMNPYSFPMEEIKGIDWF